MININYISAPCGSGKTHAIIQTLTNSDEEANTILAQPTCELIDKTEANIRSLGSNVHIKKFHSGVVSNESVSGEFIRYLRNPYPGHQIVQATHATILKTPYVPNKDRYDLIIDEVPNVFEHFHEELPNNFGLITDHLFLEPVGSSYGLLLPKNRAQLTSLAENRNGDKIDEIFSTLAKQILSPHHDCYVRLEQFEKLLKRRGDSRYLSVYIVLKPSILDGYNSVTIAGACLEETLLYNIWRDMGVSFRANEALASKLRYKEHQNGSLVTISYGSEKNWSKKLRDSNDGLIRSAMIGSVPNLFRGEPFLWNENNDVKDSSPLNELEKQIRLPGISHGLNDYTHVDHAIIIPALNMKPDVSRFLREVINISPNQQRVAHTYHSVYQALSRTSVRDPDNIKPKHWIVADSFTAKYIADRYPGATVRPLGVDQPVNNSRPGRRRIHDSANERKNASKKRRMSVIAGLEGETFFVRKQDANTVLLNQDSGDEKTIDSISNFVAQFHGSLFKSKFDRESGSQFICTDEKFIRMLRKRSKIRYDNKEDNELISPAYFNPHKVEHSDRGVDNIEFVKGIWIDVDDGNLMPDEFASLFPHLRIVCYNSYSSTKDQLRYRAFIPTDQAMTNQAYRMIIKEVKYVVEQAGFTPKEDYKAPQAKNRHGIDNKINGSDLFYLPCQPADPSGAFFKDYKADKRKPLKVKDWILHGIAEEEATSGLSMPGPCSGGEILSADQEAKIAEAKGEWDEIGCRPGRGHEAIFRLGQRLRRAGVNHWQMENILLECAQQASTPADRVKDVRRFVSRLHRNEL